MINNITDILKWDTIEQVLINKAALDSSICIRIPIDRIPSKNDICLVNRNNDDKTNSELKREFQKRWFYTESISSNKSVVQRGKGIKYPKTITSCQKNAIIVNRSKIDDNIGANDKKNIEIKRIKEQEILEEMILEFLRVIEADEETVNIYKRNMVHIFKLFNEIEDFSKYTKIRLFLDRDIEEYKKCYKDYIDKKILDNSQIINGVRMGEVPIFCGYDKLKPLLKDVGNFYNDTKQIYTAEQGHRLNMLLKYLLIERKGKLKIKTGTLEYETHYNPSNAKIYFSKFNFTPYATNEVLDKKPLIIKNILEIRGVKEIVLNKENSLIYFISSVFGKKDVDNYINEKFIYISEKKCSFLQTYYSMFKKVNTETYNNIKNNIARFTKKLYGVYDGSINQEDYYNKAKVLNFNICAKDYFLNTNMEGLISNMYDKAKSKILNKTDYNVESVEELSFIFGQLGRFLRDQSKSGKEGSLLVSYELTRNITSLFRLIERDMALYGYKINRSSRVNRVYSGLLKYWSFNKPLTLNREMFLIGLLSNNNVFYSKSDKESTTNNNENIL